MSFQLSEEELAKLYISWLAWKDLESEEFLGAFKPLWSSTLKDIAALLEKCNIEYGLENIHRIGLTIQPEISFAFSSLRRMYYVNVWSFLFSHQKQEGSLYFKPLFRLAHELVHEYAHYRFWRDHDMLDGNATVMRRFENEHGLENEKYALTEEADFLRRVQFAVPRQMKIRLFRVRSWTSQGLVDYESGSGRISVRKGIKLSVKAYEKEIQQLSSREDWTSRSRTASAEKHTTFGSILKLELTGKEYPILVMEV